jgi:hypothetical protein
MRRASSIYLILLVICNYAAQKILSFYLAKILLSFLSCFNAVCMYTKY